MLTLGNTTRVYLAVGATDMRKGFEGLFAHVNQSMQLDPLSGHLYVFCNRARTRIKVLYWDGSGLWVCGKRLEKGCFAWPANPGSGEPPQTTHSLTQAEWTLLVAGLDLRSVRERRWHRIERIECNKKGEKEKEGHTKK